MSPGLGSSLASLGVQQMDGSWPPVLIGAVAFVVVGFATVVTVMFRRLRAVVITRHRPPVILLPFQLRQLRVVHHHPPPDAGPSRSGGGADLRVTH